jgi:hypothetical protein
VCGDVIVGLMCRVGLEALYLIKMMGFSILFKYYIWNPNSNIWAHLERT